ERGRLKDQGFRVEEFDAARSVEDAKRQIARMGDLVHHSDRALAVIAGIDAAVARAREAVARKPLRVLALSRRGWVSGGDSLTSTLLATGDLSNAAARIGLKPRGRASLTPTISLQADLIL